MWSGAQRVDPPPNRPRYLRKRRCGGSPPSSALRFESPWRYSKEALLKRGFRRSGGRETEIHNGSMLAWRLPELPRDLREKLCYEGFPLTVAEILPPELKAAG